jgi:hypothetical protein
VEDTTISLKKKTRDRLYKFGMKGETWDALVNRILNELEESKK